jgi:tetratricopeptide (TPR) repeat protein/transcriptional regulator with XRE-family HTH domain
LIGRRVGVTCAGIAASDESPQQRRPIERTTAMTSRKDLDDLEEIAKLRAHGRAQGWPIPQIVEAIAERFGVSRLKAHRLARGWTRPQAVEEILATYDADGWPRPKLTPQRLCAWEHNPRVRPGEEYLDRLCRVYQTRADQLGYGHDYTPPAASPTGTKSNGQQAVPATGSAGDHPDPAYAGTPTALPAVVAGEHSGADREAQSDSAEAATNRSQFLQRLGASSMAVLLDRAAKESAHLSQRLEESNTGPATIEHLQLRVAGFVHSWEHTSSEQMFAEVLDQRRQVAALLKGRQPLTQRCQLHRIAGQLTVLLAGCSFDLGKYPATYAHCLTAEQLARETGDDALLACVRVWQSTAALWDGDPRMALRYAQDAQQHAPTPAARALIAVRCEARALARMRDRGRAFDAVRRARRDMSSEAASDDPDEVWWLFSPGALELYTGITLLWLGRVDQAEPHARQAIAYYQTAPRALASSANQSQAQINLAICLVGQDQPDEGIKLASEAIGLHRGDLEANLQQAGEFLAALKPAHRTLATAREFAEQLQALRATRPTVNPG